MFMARLLQGSRSKVEGHPRNDRKTVVTLGSCVVSTTFSRLTKLRGIATYDFDDVGVRRCADGIEKAKFSWADFTHWEQGGNAYWLLAKHGAVLVPLRLISPADRTALADLLNAKLGASRPLSAFEGLLAKDN